MKLTAWRELSPQLMSYFDFLKKTSQLKMSLPDRDIPAWRHFSKRQYVQGNPPPGVGLHFPSQTLSGKARSIVRL